jgi:hypothetical protein
MNWEVRPGPGGFEQELVFARWPDGWFASRYLMSEEKLQHLIGQAQDPNFLASKNSFIVSLCRIGEASYKQSWVGIYRGTVLQPTFELNFGAWRFHSEAGAILSRWRGLVEATMVDPSLSKVASSIHLKLDELARVVTQMVVEVPLELEPNRPDQVVDELEAYALLAVDHPIWSQEDVFMEWVQQARPSFDHHEAVQLPLLGPSR